MKKLNVWKKNGTDSMPIYDFIPPKTWTYERIKAEEKLISDEVAFLLSNPRCVQDGWANLFSLLPTGLKNVVLFELLNGNSLVSIGMSGWPNSQSVVVNLKNRFQVASRNLAKAARWRLLNDPHYCNEEISEISESAEHLLIS